MDPFASQPPSPGPGRTFDRHCRDPAGLPGSRLSGLVCGGERGPSACHWLGWQLAHLCPPDPGKLQAHGMSLARAYIGSAGELTPSPPPPETEGRAGSSQRPPGP